MIYHNIYDSWAWMGGHADGEEDLFKVAEREAKEESGITDIKAISEEIASIEILPVSGHEKKGKYVINICMGTACFVRGADKILKEFEEKLGIKNGETTPDGKFTLSTLRCVGACGLAPVVQVNGKTYGNATLETVTEILEEYSKEEE